MLHPAAWQGADDPDLLCELRLGRTMGVVDDEHAVDFQMVPDRARAAKPAELVFDLTHVLADVSEKALNQVKRGAVELLTPRLEQAAAEEIAEKLAGEQWTHDYALTATEATALGLPVKVGMPLIVMKLMKLYPQPIQSSSVEFLPIDLPRTRRAA